MYTKGISFTAVNGDSELTGVRSDVVVLFADLRGFSTWCISASLEQVSEVIKIQYERVIQICSDFHHTFHKFLGDGFLLLWEPDADLNLTVCVKHALDASIEVHKKYWYLVKELKYKTPLGYGIGLSVGSAIRIQPETFIKEMNEVDFLGYPLNCSARMQSLADPFGTTICSTLAGLLERNRDEFLYPNERVFRRELHIPSSAALSRARSMKGLQSKDKTDFRYLTWPHIQDSLWGVNGIPST
jgi:class 3 adenylate cyclase